jgi:hypothetical protein
LKLISYPPERFLEEDVVGVGRVAKGRQRDQLWPMAMDTLCTQEFRSARLVAHRELDDAVGRGHAGRAVHVSRPMIAAPAEPLFVHRDELATIRLQRPARLAMVWSAMRGTRAAALSVAA